MNKNNGLQSVKLIQSQRSSFYWTRLTDTDTTTELVKYLILKILTV